MSNQFNKILVIPKVGGSNVEKSHEHIEFMRENLAEFYSEYDLKIITSIDEVDEHTVAVPVGGDGTVLHLAKKLIQSGYDIPIIGFNLGQLGFLTDLNTDNNGISISVLYDTILDLDTRYNAGPFIEDYRTLLSVNYEEHEFLAMNDFVISNLYSDCIIKYDLMIGESYAGQHKANGVIISTPTGSTAYAMNVGGAIIEPDLNVIEIIPVAGMGMTCRPIIVNGNKEISISVKATENHVTSLKADGQECAKIYHKDANFKIIKHEKKVKLLHVNEWNFFTKMTEKLNWNAK